MRNLASEQTERVGEMRRRLEALLAAAPDAPEDAESAVGPQELEQLRALGYAAAVNAPQTAPALDALELAGPDPDRARDDLSLYVQAVGFLADGEFRRAEILYDAVHRRHPGSTPALGGLIHAKQSLGKEDEAAVLMREIIELEPTSLGYRLELAKLLNRRGDTEEAERLLLEVLALDPCSGAGRLQLSQIERRRGLQSRRIDVLAEGVERCPDLVVARNALAYALATVPDASLRDAERAVRLAEASVEATEGQHPDYLDTLAAAYAESGDFERAMTTQRRALALVEGRELLPQLVNHLKRHLALYEAGEPLRLP
jgi:tetratricopeptide (TPR) repeat protein